MADSEKLADAFVQVRGDNSKLGSDLADASKMITNAFKGIGKDAFGGISFGDVIKNTVENERAVGRLKAALASVGEGGSLDGINEFAERMKELYKVDDDLIRQTVTLGLNMGLGAEQSMAAAKAAIGLADVLGTDVKGAMEAVGKASNGSFREFERIFPQMKNLQTQEEKLEFIQRKANEGLRQRAAATDGLGGSMEALRLATADVEKAVGQIIAQPLAEFFNSATAALKTFTGGTFNLLPSALLVKEKIAQMFLGLGQAIGDKNMIEQSQANLKEVARGYEQLEKESVAHVNAMNQANTATAKLKMSDDARRDKEAADRHNRTTREMVQKDRVEFLTLDELWRNAQSKIEDAPPAPNPAPADDNRNPLDTNAGKLRTQAQRMKDRADSLKAMAEQVDPDRAAVLREKASELNGTRSRPLIVEGKNDNETLAALKIIAAAVTRGVPAVYQ